MDLHTFEIATNKMSSDDRRKAMPLIVILLSSLTTAASLVEEALFAETVEEATELLAQSQTAALTVENQLHLLRQFPELKTVLHQAQSFNLFIAEEQVELLTGIETLLTRMPFKPTIH